MEAVFESLKSQGKNDIEHIIEWLKQAKIIIDDASEAAARKIFEGCEKAKIEYPKFKEAVTKIAEETKSNVIDLHKKLEDVAPTIHSALQGASSALTGLFGK